MQIIRTTTTQGMVLLKFRGTRLRFAFAVGICSGRIVVPYVMNIVWWYFQRDAKHSQRGWNAGDSTPNNSQHETLTLLWCGRVQPIKSAAYWIWRCGGAPSGAAILSILHRCHVLRLIVRKRYYRFVHSIKSIVECWVCIVRSATVNKESSMFATRNRFLWNLFQNCVSKWNMWVVMNQRTWKKCREGRAVHQPWDTSYSLFETPQRLARFSLRAGYSHAYRKSNTSRWSFVVPRSFRARKIQHPTVQFQNWLSTQTLFTITYSLPEIESLTKVVNKFRS